MGYRLKYFLSPLLIASCLLPEFFLNPRILAPFFHKHNFSYFQDPHSVKKKGEGQARSKHPGKILDIAKGV
ncbi:MAG: hypothetical protein A2Y79_01985 [Deltaproteobacteria bacterium RBG_13_43_22]|nr:MAG: hypothetical protein A2Y79_01985 [Deltaproteobacteria bacterium RBG_13_43_22]